MRVTPFTSSLMQTERNYDPATSFLWKAQETEATKRKWTTTIGASHNGPYARHRNERETHRKWSSSEVRGTDPTCKSEHLLNQGVSDKVLITRVTSDTAEIKTSKMKRRSNWKKLALGTYSCEGEFIQDTHKGILKISQSEHATISTIPAPTMDEDTLQQILDLKTCLD